MSMSPLPTSRWRKQYEGFLQSFDAEQLTLKIRIKTREKELTFDRKNIAKLA